MVLVKARVTARDYLAMPEVKPYLEYAYGEVRQKAMPNFDHMEIVDAVAEHLRAYRKERPGSHSGPEPRIRLETVRGFEFRIPDYAYWAPSKPVRDGDHMLPPTLAVEVRSPDESMDEQREKCRYYRAHGVDVCWLFDPLTRTVELFEGSRDAEPVPVLTSASLPGLSIEPLTLFP